VAVLHAAAAGNDDLGSGQFRTIRLGQLFTDESRFARVRCAANCFNGSGTTFSSHRIKTGATHGDDFNGSGRLHGGDGVTGVDRTLESVSAFSSDDFRNLINVQRSGNAR